MTDDPPPAGRILLVDDNEAIVDTYAGFLETQYDVTTATDAETALATVDADTDVVFLDRRMPGRSGDEVLADLRDQGSDAIVVLLTAVDPDAAVVDLPLDDYLTKPVQPTAIPDVVDTMLTRRQLPAAARDLLAMIAKRNLLDRTLTVPEFDRSPERQRLDEDIAARLSDVETPVDELEDGLTGDLPDLVRERA